MKMDDLLRDFLFRGFRLGNFRFYFLEALLAVCITGVGFLLRTPFSAGLPHWSRLLAEWYLGMAAAALVFAYTKSRRKALGTYAVLMILPTLVAEGTILRGDACVGTLFFVCMLFFLKRNDSEAEGQPWIFTLAAAALLLWSIRYIGILFACMVLWRQKRLDARQLLLLFAAGCARFLCAYRVWFSAGYTLTTFYWPNVYELVGREAVRGQLIDPIARVGFFLTPGLIIFCIRLLGQRAENRADGDTEAIGLFLFFGLTAGYFLPYIDQSYGCLYSVLAVIYAMLRPGEFLLPILLQIVTYAGYQERFNGASMMPMTVFGALQFLIICWLGARLLFHDTGVLDLWKQGGRKNWPT